MPHGGRHDWTCQVRPPRLPMYGRTERAPRKILQRSLQTGGRQDRAALRLSAPSLQVGSDAGSFHSCGCAERRLSWRFENLARADERGYSLRPCGLLASAWTLAVVPSAIAIAAVVAFAKTLVEKRNLRLENQKLQFEISAMTRQIVLPTDDQIARYSFRRLVVRRTVRLGAAFLAVALPVSVGLQINSERSPSDVDSAPPTITAPPSPADPAPAPDRVASRRESPSIDAPKTSEAVPRLSLIVNEQEDTAQITNTGDQAVNLTGWQLVRVRGNHVFNQFPAGFTLAPGASLTVTSGPAARAGAGFLRWTEQDVWSNSGDHGRLIDADGNVVAEDE